ncbi:DUF4202 domain-containing protein [Cyclobacterium qasimii]|uniref:DUF4202 domain-containing protein n=2 Tax=Cyclobacterium qasimii TaxID=1350429 RepID=S7WWY7_9BACT|nr:DUF4202 domain-containing protein [Cyclobacterium qasimii]EPR68518.1 hypothetical protein ADICYQ_2484 [Cyclobacterium qasimii M12-11B]GEO23698.1 hypothetical protein CQA01_42320 [Cyclobacterium qasimii]
MSNSDLKRFENTVREIDAVNAKDPNKELVNGEEVPKELVYGQRMSEMMEETYPDGDEILKLAARCQHIKRWEIPREDYPMDRKGYLLWRTKLKQFHGELAAEILGANDYSSEDLMKIEDLINKRRLKSDPETQALEDVVCLVFLKYYFDAFINKHEEEKLLGILQKTWHKMSPKGHEKALSLSHSEKALALINKALN